jgi:hypothetical protein
MQQQHVNGAAGDRREGGEFGNLSILTKGWGIFERHFCPSYYFVVSLIVITDMGFIRDYLLPDLALIFNTEHFPFFVLESLRFLERLTHLHRRKAFGDGQAIVICIYNNRVSIREFAF